MKNDTYVFEEIWRRYHVIALGVNGGLRLEALKI